MKLKLPLRLLPFPLFPLAALTFLALPGSAEPVPLNTGVAAQSSQLGGFAAGNALDDAVNFTHTLSSDANPTWQVLLPETYRFGILEIFKIQDFKILKGFKISRFQDFKVSKS